MRRAPTKRFLFRLALKCGQWHPYRMARRMPAWLLNEWQAYAAIEPFDEVRADLRSAQIVQMLYNLNRDSKKDPNGKRLGEFLLEFDKDEQTDEEKRKILDNKFRVMELIHRAQAEAAKEMQQSAPKTTEYVYPSLDVIGTEGGKAMVEVLLPMTVNEQDVLAKARAAMKEV